jgi:hypothetical protein
VTTEEFAAALNGKPTAAGRWQSQRAFYLEAWSGDSGFTIDRIGRGTIHVEDCCISLFGGIQPPGCAGISPMHFAMVQAMMD